MERVLDFMTEPEHVNSTNNAYGLIGAYAIVYIGIEMQFPENTRALADNII